MKKVHIDELPHNLLIENFRNYNNYSQIFVSPDKCIMDHEMTEEEYNNYYKELSVSLRNIINMANKILKEIRFTDENYIPPKLVKKIENENN